VFGAAFVRGLQGNNVSKYLQANAGCKHFADFAGPRNSNMDHTLSERDRVTTYLPQFKRCVEAGAPSLMCAYSATNGVPACGDSGLLNDILRSEWGFKGYVISDQDALLKATGLAGEDQALGYTPFNQSHVVAAAAFVNAGLDLEDSDYNSTIPGSTKGRANILQYLPDAIESKLIDEAAIDSSVSRAFTVRMQLGEFDDDSSNPWKKLKWEELVESPDHQSLAREATHKSLVLLRNVNAALPLSTADLGSRKVAIVGPWSTGFVNCSSELKNAARRGCDRGALYYGDYSPGRYEYDQANVDGGDRVIFVLPHGHIGRYCPTVSTSRSTSGSSY
jgi:beta-glucosidase